MMSALKVALHEGCVDRNLTFPVEKTAVYVALHEGCVDRNP